MEDGILPRLEWRRIPARPLRSPARTLVCALHFVIHELQLPVLLSGLSSSAVEVASDVLAAFRRPARYLLHVARIPTVALWPVRLSM